MKRIFCIISLIVFISLVFSGCGKNMMEAKVVTGEDTEKVTGPASAEPEAPAEPEAQAEPEAEEPQPEPEVTSVTQEELDRLKEDLESLEAEDLGGLSED